MEYRRIAVAPSYGHILVNELADFAAERYCDHAGGGKSDKDKYYQSTALLELVCKRIAVIEATLREYTTDILQVAADVINSCDAVGERRRQQIKDRTDSRIKKFTGQYNHNVDYIPHANPPTC